MSDLHDDERAVWSGFVQVHAALERGLDADLRAAHGLPLNELEILRWLAARPCEQMRMAALTGAAPLSTSGVSRAVERLAARGLVRRVPCPEDRRGAYAVLTGEGTALVRAASATLDANIRGRFLDRISAEQQRALLAVWDRILPGGRGGCPGPRSPCGDDGPRPINREGETL